MTRRGGDKWQQIQLNSKVGPWLGGWQYTSLKYKDQRYQINKTHTKHYTHSHIVYKNDFLTYQASSCIIKLNYSKQNSIFHLVHFSSIAMAFFRTFPSIHFSIEVRQNLIDENGPFNQRPKGGPTSTLQLSAFNLGPLDGFLHRFASNDF